VAATNELGALWPSVAAAVSVPDSAERQLPLLLMLMLAISLRNKRRHFCFSLSRCRDNSLSQQKVKRHVKRDTAIHCGPQKRPSEYSAVNLSNRFS